MLIRSVQRLFRILLTCSAQVHQVSDVFSDVCDLCLFSYPDVCLSVLVGDVNILLSIFQFAAASLCFALVVCAYVFAPYVFARSTHEL